MADAAIDNDVLFKSVCYGFFTPLVAAMSSNARAGVLGTARFVLPKLLRKRPPHRFNQARLELDQALKTLEVFEPTEAESELAAQLEFEAQRQRLPVHAGESLLIAIVLVRDLRWLLTGDRAAIEGLGRLMLPPGLDPARLSGRIACFEQAIRRLLDALGANAVKTAICAEREVDANLRACFSCASPEVGEASWREGLDSHIKCLRANAGAILMP